jgi:ribosomal subunit interface protein
MQKPLEINFRHMDPSDAVEARIREEVDKLESFSDQIIGCRVTFESPHQRHRQGKLYLVRIDLTVPGREIVVNREQHDKHAHEDPYVAIRDAFNAMRRQLQEYGRKERGEVKVHEQQPTGRVTQLFPDEDFGFLESTDGTEVYFHRNSVLGDEFDKLEVGSAVRFVQEQGAEGPQASTVELR